jgi:hypothetical protein
MISSHIYRIKWERIQTKQKIVQLPLKKYPLPWKEKIKSDMQQFYLVYMVTHITLKQQIPMERRHPGILSAEEEAKLIKEHSFPEFARDAPTLTRYSIVSQMLQVMA